MSLCSGLLEKAPSPGVQGSDDLPFPRRISPDDKCLAKVLRVYRGAVGREKSLFLTPFLFLIGILHVTRNILWADGVSADELHRKAVTEIHHSFSM